MGEPFAVLVQALVGPAGGDGEESFSFEVCSPDWLAAQELEKGFRFVRAVLIVNAWDPPLIERAIADRCSRSEGQTWQEVATSLSRYGSWEFEDYRE